jgi:hypothetical protein
MIPTNDSESFSVTAAERMPNLQVTLDTKGRSFGQLAGLPGFGYHLRQIQAEAIRQAQCNFQGWFTQTPLDVTNHLLGNAGAPLENIFGSPQALTFFTQQPDDLITKLGVRFVGVHGAKLPEKAFDRIRHRCYVSTNEISKANWT